jgi:hypothetical protein
LHDFHELPNICFVAEIGGADRDRTDDLLNAIQALSQLSYGPTKEANGKKKQTCRRTGNILKQVAKVKSAIHFPYPLAMMIFHDPS